MFGAKKYQVLWMLVLVLLCASFVYSQTGAGGAMSQGAAGNGAIGAMSGQLGGILNKTVFSRNIKKSSTGSVKPKTVPKNTVSKNKTVTPKTKNVKTPYPKAPTEVPETDEDVADFSVIKYQPIGNTNFNQQFADMITQKPDEKAALLLIFNETKKAYNAEAQKLGKPNDLALVFTFFITACLTVYHDAPEPSDQATENLYNVLAESLSESPQMAQMSNYDKNLTAEKLLYISGLVYAGYLSGKQTQDFQTLQIYRQTAGVCFQTVVGISAESIEFDKNGLRLRP